MRFKITLLPRAIRSELVRLGASDMEFDNLSYGPGRLRRDTVTPPFRYVGRSHDILAVLRTLPDNAGSEAVQEAFSDTGREGAEGGS